ncbi:MAG: hypothetical protein IAE91_07220 [Ignavibacteriaceae bacterium]|nr:hypothetical protein [Ignavibacteriaceae bacterium]
MVLQKFLLVLFFLFLSCNKHKSEPVATELDYFEFTGKNINEFVLKFGDGEKIEDGFKYNFDDNSSLFVFFDGNRTISDISLSITSGSMTGLQNKLENLNYSFFKNFSYKVNGKETVNLIYRKEGNFLLLRESESGSFLIKTIDNFFEYKPIK